MGLKVSFEWTDVTQVSYPHPAVHMSIDGALAEHADLMAKRQRFLEDAAAIVAAAPASEDELSSFHIAFPKPKGARAFLNRVDQVLRDAAR